MAQTQRLSKSEVMSRAWRIYRSKFNNSSFGACLSRAWQVEKENVAFREEQAKEAALVNYPRTKVEFSEEQIAANYQAKAAYMENYYSRNGYHGD